MFGLNLKSGLQSIAKKLNVSSACARGASVAMNQIQQTVRGMANHRHKKILKLAKGYKGRANRCYTIAIQRVTRAKQNAYRGRKEKKRNFRKLWIQRINAASRMHGVAYSILINNLAKSDIVLNRKVLSDLAVTEPLTFKAIVEVSNQAKTKIKPEIA